MSVFITITAIVCFSDICGAYISSSDQYKTQPEAENYCQIQYGSHLATITSSSDNTEALNLCSGNSWIGLNDLDTEGTYTWLDGSDSSYRNWNSGEPNNGLGSYEEDCVVLSVPHSGRWADAACTASQRFLCNDMVSSCLEGDYIDSIIWDKLLLSNNMSHQPYSNLDIFSIDSSDLSLNITVKLSYLQYSSAENGDDDYGTTYWLDFQPFNPNNLNKIYEPGSCGNRLATSYYNNSTLRDFNEWWLFSDRPYLDGNLANDSYLAYPDPGSIWELNVVDGVFETQCSRITYSASFSWTQLIHCNGVGNTVQIFEDDEFINLTGLFYVDLVSPLDKTYDSSYYRVYELLSQPFEISLKKTMQILSLIDLNLFEMYLLSIFSENDNGNFVINVMTESAYYIYLDEAMLINYPTQLTTIESIEVITDSISTSCIPGMNNICRQIFEINVQFGDNYCNVNNQTNFDLSGFYGLSLNINCDNDNTSTCIDYVTNYGSSAILSFYTEYVDYSCDVIKSVNISYDAVMRFYSTENYMNYSNNSILYEYGDTVYVEIEAFNLPQNMFDYLSLSLLNVWICQYDDNLGSLPDPQTYNLNGGCLANQTYDFNLYYHIYPTLSQNTMLQNENISNIVRFSFEIPEKDNENRDKLFVHGEIELSFNNITRRRLLLSIQQNNLQTNYVQVGDYILVSSKTVESTEEHEDKENDINKLWIAAVVIVVGVIITLLLLISIIWMVWKCRGKQENSVAKVVDFAVIHNLEGAEKHLQTDNI